MKREECKSIEELLEVSDKEHRAVDNESGRFEFGMTHELTLIGHEAICLMDMMHTVGMGKDSKEKSINQNKLMQRIFEEGMKIVWAEYRKRVIDSLGENLPSGAMVVKDKDTASKIMELISKLKGAEKGKREDVTSRLDKFLKDE